MGTRWVKLARWRSAEHRAVEAERALQATPPEATDSSDTEASLAQAGVARKLRYVAAVTLFGFLDDSKRAAAARLRSPR